MDNWDEQFRFNKRAAGKHLTATKNWAAKCARENPPQAFIARIDPTFEKHRGMRRSGQDVLSLLQKFGVDPDDIEVGAENETT